MGRRIFSGFLTLILIASLIMAIAPTGYAANPVSAEDIVAISKELARANPRYKYVSGGYSPTNGGFDCTGLIYYVYHTRLGYNMTLEQARSKSKLLKMGTKISKKSDLLPGDIIQYNISHVAIYIGNNTVLHAGTDRGVCTTTLENTNPKYNRCFSYGIRLPGVVQDNGGESGGINSAPTITITFDPNGGRVLPITQVISKGSDPRNLPTPVRDGYAFCGWTLDKNSDDFNGASAVVTENSAYGFETDTTIYASWRRNSQGADGM